MREYIIRQVNRRWQDLAFDAYVFGMLALCVVGGWVLGDCVNVSMKAVLTTSGQGPNVKPYIVSRTMLDATTKRASYIVCNGCCSHALVCGGRLMARVRTSWTKTKRK